MGYTIRFTTSKIDHPVVVNNIKATNIRKALQEVEMEWDWAKPLDIQYIMQDPYSDSEEYEDHSSCVVLTNKEWQRLSTYLLMSTRYREGEQKTWEDLASEQGASENCRSNAGFWKEQNELMETIIDKIDKER